jgi:hypothetical protein
MKIKYDHVKVRFFLSKKASEKLGHNIDHVGFNRFIDKLAVQECVEGIDYGSGHCGIYIDIDITCDPELLPARIASLISHARSLTLDYLDE